MKIFLKFRSFDKNWHKSHQKLDICELTKLNLNQFLKKKKKKQTNKKKVKLILTIMWG